MKILLNVVLCVVLSFAVSVNAEGQELFDTVNTAINLDKNAARTIRALEEDGFVEVNHSMQEVMYFTACMIDCTKGIYTIIMRSPTAGDYSLERTYAYVNITLITDYETGKYYVESVNVVEQTVY